MAQLRARMVPLDTALDAGALASLRCEPVSQPNPFLEPPFLAPFSPLFDEGAALFLAEDEHGPLGLLPLARRRGYARLPLRHAATALHPHLFDATPLVRRGAEAAFAEALLDHEPGLIHLTHLRRGPVLDALLAAAASARRPAQIVHVALRPFLPAGAAPDLGDYLARHVGPRTRKSYNRLRRRLEARGAVSIERAGEDVAADDAVEAFLRAEHAGWKGEGGTSVLSRPDEAEAFRAMARAAASGGRLRVTRLCVDGVPIAHAVDLAAGQGVFSLKTAYDEAWSDCSPGFLLEVALIEQALAEPERWTDSCAAEGHDTLSRLWPATHEVVQLLVGGASARDRAVFAGVRALERLGELRRAA